MRSSLIEQSSLVLRGFVVFTFIALAVEQAIQLGMAGSSALVIGAPLLAENAARGIPINDHSLFHRRNPQLNDMTSDIAHDTSTEGTAASSTLAGVYSSVLATPIPGAFPTGSMAQEIPDHSLKSLPRRNPQLNDVTSDIAHNASTEGTAASSTLAGIFSSALATPTPGTFQANTPRDILPFGVIGTVLGSHSPQLNDVTSETTNKASTIETATSSTLADVLSSILATPTSGVFPSII